MASSTSSESVAPVGPRDRIPEAADELFSRRGIRVVGIGAIIAPRGEDDPRGLRA